MSVGDLSKDFSRHEWRCSCGCGHDTVDAELLQAMQELRDYYNEIVTITSGCRCPEANLRAGGVSGSMHLHGRACDFVVAGVRPQEVQAYLSMKYDGRMGLGKYSGFTHFDTRSGPPARWSG